MDADQFRAIIDACRRDNAIHTQHVVEAVRAGGTTGHKVPEFSSADPNEWHTWRANFEIMTRNSNWDNARARRECSIRMTGIAAEMTRGIPTGDGGNNVEPVAGLLDAYQAIFVTAEAGATARADIRAARQREDETVQAWHSRHLTLACRAYPERRNNPNDGANIDSFIEGLYDTAVQAHCWNQNIQTYQQALNAASTGAATQVRVEHATARKGKIAALQAAADASRIAALGAAKGQGSATCYVCHKPGHFKHECEFYRRCQELDRRGRGRRGGFRGRGRGGSSHRGRTPYQRTGRSRGVNALSDLTDDREPDYSKTYSEN